MYNNGPSITCPLAIKKYDRWSQADSTILKNGTLIMCRCGRGIKFTTANSATYSNS